MTFPPEMIEALRRREAVLVAGNGCGALCGQPGWRARLEALAAALPAARALRMRALLEREAWGTALFAARDALGPEAARVVAGLNVASGRIPPVLRALASMPWRAVITTGFDESWARVLAATGAAPAILCAGEPLAPPAAGRRLLVHAFGRAVRPETLCLAAVDLPERVAAHGLQDRLRDLARAGTFIYVGFQPADPDLEWLAGRVLGPAGRERSHFALVTDGAGVGGSPFRGGFGIRPMVFGGSLEAGLAALAEAAAEATGTRSQPGEVEVELDLEELHDEPAPRPRAAPPVPLAPPLPPVSPEANSPELRRSIREAIDRNMEQERWAEAAQGLGRLAELEPDAGARARLLHAQALVLKDTLQDRPGAIALLERALEADPALLPAWDALEPLHRGGGDPMALRRCYARALQALGRTAERTLALRLWAGLAEVSWRSLGDHPTAVAALEAARALDPDNEGHERSLAALYLKVGPSAAEKALFVHQSLAARAPDEPEPYRVLERLWRADGAREKAFWASSVLQQLGQGTDHQAGPRNTLRLGAPATLARTLSDSLWECLYHPEEDRVLSTLFLVLGPSLLALMDEPNKRFPPRGAEAVPVVDPSPTRPSRAAAGPVTGGFAPAALAHVAQALEVAPPALFLVDRARRSVDVRLRAGGPGVRHALVVDRRFADRAPEAEVLFDLARTVALLRPPWFLRFGQDVPAMLALGLRAAFALGDGPDSEKGDVRRLLQHLREERPDLAQEQVVALASELTHRRQQPDLARWLAGVELSAARAALTLTGDLEAAVRRVSAEPAQPGGLGPGERVKDLLAFAVSEDHFAARAALALDVQVGLEVLA
jgi:tetratricopeptide (TPR) repeat protein